jgi:hypothetical protein
MSQPAKTALIVEPNKTLLVPYASLPRHVTVFRVASAPAALQWLSGHTPDLFFLSASFAPSIQVRLLEAFKNSFTSTVIPLVLVIDLSQPLSHIPGTTWGKRLAILHSQQTNPVVVDLLKPLM